MQYNLLSTARRFSYYETIGHGQGEELPLPLHRSARQVGQDGKAERAQHLFQKALRPHLGLRIGKTPSRVEKHRQRDLG